MTARSLRRGATLIELLLTVAVLGIVASVVTLAFRAPAVTAGESEASAILDARRLALREGRTIVVDIATPHGVRTVAARPDGSIVADSSLPVGRLDIVGSSSRK